jgi:hypothetical protein
MEEVLIALLTLLTTFAALIALNTGRIANKLEKLEEDQ